MHMLLYLTLLDAEQVNDVYHGTGNVAEDGWVATESGQQWLANRLATNPDVRCSGTLPG